MSQVRTENLSYLDSQPYLPFLEVSIAGHRFTKLPPKYIQSFEFNRLDEAVGTFTMTIFDDNWEEVERTLTLGWDSVQFRYGHVTGKQSSTYSADLLEYSLEFNPAGVLLAVQGITKTAGALLTDTIATGNNPTEAAKVVCRSKGWVVNDEYFHESFDVEDLPNMIEDYPIKYLQQEIAPLAVRKADGVSGYRFYLDESTDPPTAHFAPVSTIDNPQKTYIYSKGLNSNVLNLSVDVKGIFGASDYMKVASAAGSQIIDPITKELKSFSDNVNSVRTVVTGEYTHTRSNSSNIWLDGAGKSPDQVNAILRHKLSIDSIPYEAVLTIVGDPTINRFETIRLIVLTDEGNLHHTSGLYQVMGVTDSISGGSFTTSLKLMKNANIEDGLELLNYRSLLK